MSSPPRGRRQIGRRSVACALVLFTAVASCSGSGDQMLDAGERLALRQQLREAGANLASGGPALAVNGGDPVARGHLDRIGTLFGTVAAKSYDVEGAVDLGNVGRDIAKGILEKVGGPPSQDTEGATAIALSGATGKTIVFAFPSEERARRELRDDLREAKTGRERRERLSGRIMAGDLEHLAYVSLLADPATRDRLGVKLLPDSFPPELPDDPILRNRNVDTVEEWRAEVFPNGVLQVPDPYDHKRWGSFLAWAKYVNTQLAATANELGDTMRDSFEAEILYEILGRS